MPQVFCAFSLHILRLLLSNLHHAIFDILFTIEISIIRVVKISQTYYKLFWELITNILQVCCLVSIPASGYGRFISGALA